jgi:hypothetical protein
MAESSDSDLEDDVNEDLEDINSKMQINSGIPTRQTV